MSQTTAYTLIDIAKATVAANRIIDMRERDHTDGKLVSLDFGNIGDNDMGVKIQFQNVWFRYPTRDVPILNGLSITVGIQIHSL
jgi:ATP-binding cassette, subfamily B (MDR/TAP), member 1